MLYVSHDLRQPGQADIVLPYGIVFDGGPSTSKETEGPDTALKHLIPSHSPSDTGLCNAIGADMIPAHLVSTWHLLQRAFPDGVADADYLPLLSHLYQHMADENLAIVVAEFTGRDVGVVSNDILRVGAGERVSPEGHAALAERLREAGIEGWAMEEL